MLSGTVTARYEKRRGEIGCLFFGGEDPGTIEDVYEPYLIKNGFINRTPRGRVVTDIAYAHLGLENPGDTDI